MRSREPAIRSARAVAPLRRRRGARRHRLAPWSAAATAAASPASTLAAAAAAAGAGGDQGTPDASAGTGGAIGPPEQELDSTYQAPVSTGRFIWIANPTSGRVAYVDATSLVVKTVEAGNAPTTVAAVPGADEVVVLNVLSNDATVLRTDGTHADQPDHPRHRRRRQPAGGLAARAVRDRAGSTGGRSRRRAPPTASRR